MNAHRTVVFLPGGVTPVQPSYQPTLAELGDEIQPILKELELYAGDQPPPGYSIELEVESLRRTVDEASLDRFHLVGFSGGGAVSLAFAAAYPQRLLSLALFEPANVPGRWDEEEVGFWEAFMPGLGQLPPEQMMREFTRRQVRPGAELPSAPPGPPAPWMAKRPAGLNAMMAAFRSEEGDRDRLRALAAPVYLSYGLLTAEFMLHRVQILAALLPDIWIEAYEGIHHFVPPQRSRPARYAAALRWLWARAEGLTPDATTGDRTYAA